MFSKWTDIQDYIKSVNKLDLVNYFSSLWYFYWLIQINILHDKELKKIQTDTIFTIKLHVVIVEIRRNP